MPQLDQTDPRPYYRRGLHWVTSLLRGIRPDQLDAPTPCPDFDVRGLAGHLVATVDRARVIGEGRDVFSAPHVITDVSNEQWAQAYAAAVEKMWPIWEPNSMLQHEVSAPWGTIPGSAAIWGYLNETLVHGWDLAVATGQPAEADPEVARAALAVAELIIPDQPRGGRVPFAPAVEPAPGAGPTERLANWSGHVRVDASPPHPNSPRSRLRQP